MHEQALLMEEARAASASDGGLADDDGASVS